MIAALTFWQTVGAVMVGIAGAFAICIVVVLFFTFLGALLRYDGGARPRPGGSPQQVEIDYQRRVMGLGDTDDG